MKRPIGHREPVRLFAAVFAGVQLAGIAAASYYPPILIALAVHTAAGATYCATVVRHRVMPTDTRYRKETSHG